MGFLTSQTYDFTWLHLAIELTELPSRVSQAIFVCFLAASAVVIVLSFRWLTGKARPWLWWVGFFTFQASVAALVIGFFLYYRNLIYYWNYNVMSCAKCHQSEPSGDDTWCLGCAGWEALETELKGKWHSPAIRALANDQVISAVKHIRALRVYSAGVKSAEDSRAARSNTELRRTEDRDNRAPLPRSREAEPRRSTKAPESSEGSDEESEESSHRQCLAAKSDPARRPSEPANPPREHRQEDRKRERSEEIQRKTSHKSRKKKRKNRDRRGQVLEIEVDVSDDPADGTVWAGFLVQKVELTVMAELVLTVRSLGSEDPAATKRLSSAFNRKRGTIHLCTPICAQSDIYTLHVTHFKRYELANFSRPYITASVKTMIKKWEKEVILASDTGEDNVDLTGVEAEDKDAKLIKGDVRLKDPKEPRAKDAPKPGTRKVGDKEPKEATKKDYDREKLRARLEEAKEKLAANSSRGGAGKQAVLPPAGADGEDEEASSSAGYSMSLAPEAEVTQLGVGTNLGALEDGAPTDPRTRPGDKENQKKRKEKRHGKSHAELGTGVLAKVATRGTTSGALQKQLLQRAAEAASRKENKKKEQKKKRGKMSAEKKLLQILTKSEKKDKKDKKDKRRKRKKHHGQGSSGGPDGSGSATNSSDLDSSGPSGGSSESESGNLEAPLKKKSREKPGSVLALLVEHARQQLDQTSKVSIQPNLKQDPTKGVRIASYFAIVVRPQLGAVNAQVRELHHLSSAIDALRQGDLDILGDLLASRFIAIHQASLDNSWSAARHLELLPLEETSAAGSGVLLEARKYARLNAKLASQDQWNSGGYGKGRQGKGRPATWGDNTWQNNDSKGKGKKGSKGKNKGKNTWQNPSGRGMDADGTKQKENLPEK
eukprot:s1103_g3.t1